MGRRFFVVVLSSDIYHKTIVMLAVFGFVFFEERKKEKECSDEIPEDSVKLCWLAMELKFN